jgi:hypothetical protein
VSVPALCSTGRALGFPLGLSAAIGAQVPLAWAPLLCEQARMDMVSEVRALALAIGAIRPCPNHPEVLRVGKVDGVALAAFRVGMDPQKQAALRDLLQAAQIKCGDCAP